MTRKISHCSGVFLCWLLILCGARAQSIADLTSQANTAQSQGHYDEAITNWNALLAKEPKNGAAYRARGACYFHENDFDKAIADFSQAIALNGNDAAAYSGRGDSYFKKGGSDNNAISDFNRAIRLSPKAAIFYQHLIEVYRKRKDWDNVITNLTKLIQLNPTNTDFLLERAKLYERPKKDFDRAIADYSKVIELDPQDSWNYLNRGYAYQRQNLTDKAIADFTKIIEMEPTNSFPYYCRARAYFEAGRYKEARGEFEKGIRLNPNDSDGYLELAWCLATCPDASFRDGKEALKLEKKGCALVKNQNDPECNFECASVLAVASAEVGDFDEAVRNQKQAISNYLQFTDRPGFGRDPKTEAVQKKILQLFEQHKPYHEIVKMSDW